ncbi:transposase [Streptomyces sp. NPDC058279]|uniref:transposase n=1 Tax=Streptomyces sp. NPDC058279 TaxID=3346418 RepID=UPI0036E66A6B
MVHRLPGFVQFDRPGHLVVDRHSVHRSKKVRAWLADRPGRSTLHLLPDHEPDTSPDELVSADLGACDWARD